MRGIWWFVRGLWLGMREWIDCTVDRGAVPDKGTQPMRRWMRLSAGTIRAAVRGESRYAPGPGFDLGVLRIHLYPKQRPETEKDPLIKSGKREA